MKLDLARLVNVKRQSDGSVVAQCPACAAEGQDRAGRNHLRVWRTGAFHCILKSEDPHHNAQIRALLRGTAPDDNPDIEYIDPEPRVTTDKVYPEDSLSKLIPDYSYWIGRGARPDVIARLEGGLAPSDEKSKLSGRFVFPVRGLDGRINGFTGRLTEPSSFAPSWKHCFKSGRAVYPWTVNGPAITASGTVILVESIGCLLSLMSHDITNVLCVFGLRINGKTISTLIAANVKRVIISLNRDDDPSKGQRAAEQIKTRLCAFFNEEHVIIRLPQTGKDWNEVDEAEFAAFKEEIR